MRCFGIKRAFLRAARKFFIVSGTFCGEKSQAKAAKYRNF
jgi:hypothetical protein